MEDLINMTAEEPKVFISYSHDDESHKNWVLQLATRLRSNGVDAVLDKWLKLGNDIASFMERGLEEADKVICVCTETYIKKAEGGRGGAAYEKRIISADLVNDQNEVSIIPLIRNGAKQVPTFLKGSKYIDFSDDRFYEKSYKELLRDLLDELPIPPIGKNPFRVIQKPTKQKFVPPSEKYVSSELSGKVIFDYSNNDGRYCIGQAELMFELLFSKGSDVKIYVYSDPPSIRSVALAKGVEQINEITDARDYEASSRYRGPATNQIVILNNVNGFFAAVKILDIKDDTRDAANDEVVFEYFIQSNASPDFSNSSRKFIEDEGMKV
jgi:hypothetical protein